jgi:hypothetical protein
MLDRGKGPRRHALVSIHEYERIFYIHAKKFDASYTPMNQPPALPSVQMVLPDRATTKTMINEIQ